jgi:hypothetical protein
VKCITRATVSFTVATVFPLRRWATIKAHLCGLA